MSDARRYLDRKAKGLVTVSRVGTTYLVAEPAYDVSDGTRRPDVVTQVNMQDIEEEIAGFKVKIDALTTLKADLLALRQDA